MLRLASLLRPALFALEPEDAHRATLTALKTLPIPLARPRDPKLGVSAFGLSFATPFGVAAGFDKNAEVPDALLRLGFSHVEVGGVTPRAQTGNPRPRVFRLIPDKAIINRLGFNNEGLDVMRRRLTDRRARPAPGIVGVNLGSNKDTVDRAADFEVLIKQLSGVADYLTINVSSPNTPGLRDMQAVDALDQLLTRAMKARTGVVEAGGTARPLLLKLAPDLADEDFDATLDVAVRHGIDGLVLTNTTIRRDGLADAARARETGGLSGRPLFRLSTRMLARAHLRLGRSMPLIGVGGVSSGADAWTKIRAGASLVQLYTGLVYGGLELIDDMERTVMRELSRGNFTSLSEAVGTGAEALSRE